MASHYEINPDQRGLAVRIAQRALRVANGLATARPGNVFIPNKGEDGMSDGTGTWIGSGSIGNGGVAPWVGDKTVPGRPVGVSASSSGGVLVASWGGELDGGVPEDFGHVTIFALHDGETVELGRLTVAGSVSTGEYVGGDEVEVWAVAYDLARDPSTGELDPNVSEESDHVTVTVVDLSSEAMDVANAVGQHFWPDDAGIHVSTEEKEAEGESNILMNALGILLRAASQNLVSVTPSGFAVYDESGRVIAQLTGTSSQIGPSNGGNTVTTANGLTVRSGTTELASFRPNIIKLGANSTGSTIDFCNGSGKVFIDSSTGRLAFASKDSIRSAGSGLYIDTNDSSPYFALDAQLPNGKKALISTSLVNPTSSGGYVELDLQAGGILLNWDRGGLGGMVMRKIWSGSAGQGATINVPDLPMYNLICVECGDNQKRLFGFREKSQGTWAFGFAWGNYNLIFVAGGEFNMKSSTSLSVVTKPWYIPFGTGGQQTWAYLGNITAIYGLL